jgi:lysine-N-methylase
VLRFHAEHGLNPTHFVHPTYSAGFRCIGSACEDTCCHGWKVPVDRDAYLRFESLPESSLRTLILASLEQQPPIADSGKPSPFAIIRMTENNGCPLLSEDRLCRIQTEYGAALLPHACATYPRVIHMTDGVTETALTLSCPEAARLVLLHPDLLHPDLLANEPAVEGDPQPTLQQSWVGAVRAAVLKIATDRSYLLWQRLFLLGVFCRRLDGMNLDATNLDGMNGHATAAEEHWRRAFAYLADFDAAVASGSLRDAMRALPSDDRAQLDAVLQLAGLMLHKSNVGPRFLECVHAFTTGIGNGPGATLESLTAQYGAAHRQYFAPFLDRYPNILENLLVNTILRVRFPFGSDRNLPQLERSLPRQAAARQFALLAAQFALIRGLLIGVAGYHREQFSTDHVVHTVQAASKHFEHHPEFLKHVDSWLVENHFEEPRSLTILLNEPASANHAGFPGSVG